LVIRDKQKNMEKNFHFQEELDAALKREQRQVEAAEKSKNPEKLSFAEISKGQTVEIDGVKIQFNCMMDPSHCMMSVDGRGADFYEKDKDLIFGATKLKLVSIKQESIGIELVESRDKADEDDEDEDRDDENSGFDAAISGGASAAF
jgi:hypothetical protein